MPICPVIHVFKDASGKVLPHITGKQVPLSLAWAMTIHKSQGTTIGGSVLDLGTKEFSLGPT